MGSPNGEVPMVTILLPAYNEAKSIPVLFPKIARVLAEARIPYRIIVCDDGSQDDTPALLAEFARTMPIEVLRHKMNRGLGETSRDLFERAAEVCSPDDVIVRFDCDDTHEPDIIPRLVAKLGEGFDLAIASRYQPGGGQIGVSAYRAFISRTANLFMKCLFPLRGVREYSCGFRAYRAGLIQDAIAVFGNNFIQLKGLGFTCTLEKLIKLKLLGARCAEVPFVLRYDQKRSYSKMVSSITMVGYVTMALLYHWPWGGWRSQYEHLKKAGSGQ